MDPEQNSSLLPHPEDQQSKSLQDLSNDCILLILDEVANLPGERYRNPTNLKHLSLVNKRFRQLCLPVLFKSDKLSLSRDEIAMPKHLRSFVKAPFMLSSLIALRLNISQNKNKQAQDLNKLGNSFVAALSAMPNLEHLFIGPQYNYGTISNLKFAIETARATFLSIKILRISPTPNGAFLLRACPSLEIFIADMDNHWRKTFSALPTLTSLRRLEIEA